MSSNERSTNEVMVLAGEQSGDVHASNLVKALAAKVPNLRLSGMGGQLMAEAGVEILHDIGDISIVGFAGIPRIYPKLRRIKKDLLVRIADHNPKAVIFVDYPGFNLSCARAVRKLPQPPKCVYFITPQVWAWWKGRARSIADVFDLALNIFPFEPRIFNELGGNAMFIGNPIAYELRGSPSRESARHSLGLSMGDKVVSLLPGSRLKEIDCHVDAMVDAMKIIHAEMPGLRFLISEAISLPEGYVSNRMKSSGIEIRAVRGDAKKVIRAADAVVVASGTASLETALLGVPMVVLYAGDLFSYTLIKYFLLQVDYASLVNLLSGYEAVPELCQNQVRAQPIADALKEVLLDDGVRGGQLRAFERIQNALEGVNPYECAAARIAAEIGFGGHEAKHE
ncbi:MAG: lipid-A-disaccharide synthase [Nitrospinae bacterium]|nr:lipid-A-disaccharide synthase [Nitrospinota bacterium]